MYCEFRDTIGNILKKDCSRYSSLNWAWLAQPVKLVRSNWRKTRMVLFLNLMSLCFGLAALRITRLFVSYCDYITSFLDEHGLLIIFSWKIHQRRLKWRRQISSKSCLVVHSYQKHSMISIGTFTLLTFNSIIFPYVEGKLNEWNVTEILCVLP